ncbi:winged helix-turn-helix transcriptional regulator [Nonomuraea sp. NPDC048916]|uniref:winged helix-turn-helix transcriptional regulator n=1 Tax=Nonomuraea sp. NPDC048916 TaxID=3154232 RepID=UPI0033E342BD
MERTYNQYCATARTLDIVGERWTLLLIRELLTGPKRFSDLQHSLRGLGTGLLSARMKTLEHRGLVRKVTLPPPARTPAYALTPAGADLAPVVLGLARWGLKWAMGEPREGEAFHPGWAVLGLQACFQAEAAAGLRVVYEFRVGDEVFHARVHDGTLETVHGPAQYPDVVLTTDELTFRDIAAGGTTLADALKDGSASASGDRAALRALRTLFRLPPSRDRGAGTP